MSEPMTLIAVGGFALAGLALTLIVALKGWQGWLEIKRMELAGGGGSDFPRQRERSQAGDMIEMADLRERVRKLEAIASCVDL